MREPNGFLRWFSEGIQVQIHCLEMGFRGKDVVFPRFCDDFPWKSVSTSLSLHFFGMAGASPSVFVDRIPLILLLDVQLSNHFDAIFLQ